MVVREDFSVAPFTELADVENPTDGRHRRIVYQHSIWKGLQAGSLLGLLTATPYMYFVKGYHGYFLTSRVSTVAGLTTVGGVFISVCLCAVRLRGQTPEAICDRANRLNYNVRMNVLDRAAAGSLVAGFMVTAGIGHPMGLRPMIGLELPSVPLSRRLVLGALSGFTYIGVGLILTFCMFPFLPEPVKKVLRMQHRSAAREHTENFKEYARKLSNRKK